MWTAGEVAAKSSIKESVFQEIEVSVKALISKPVPIDKDTAKPIMDIIELRGGDIRCGVTKIQVKTLDYGSLMEHRVLPNADCTYNAATGVINVSNVTYKIKRADGRIIEFNPYKELKGAISCLRAGLPMTFEQEFAVECMWHEITHARGFGWRNAKVRPNKYLNAGVETITQFCARMSYHNKFLYDPKKTMTHAAEILEDGIGYNQQIRNLRMALKKHGFTNEAAFEYFNSKITMTYYEDINKTIEDFFAKKVSRTEARETVKKILTSTKGDVSF